MKFFLAICVLFSISAISLASEQATTVYDGAVLTEDVTWHGSIHVKGFVVVAPQATLRIDPGTIVRFSSSATQPLPNLLVQGRIHAAGTSEQPILFTSDRIKSKRGAWGGVVLLSTEKRNLFENCRIEFAETGIDIRFSSVILKLVSIVQTHTALLSHDGVIQVTGATVSDSGTGFELFNSEFDGRDMLVTSCQHGYVLNKSSIALASSNIIDNRQTGLEANDCRIKISGGEFSGNTLGARISGGEGQVVMTRFLKNRQTALHLVSARIKVQRCTFAENSNEAIRTEDGRALLINNAFNDNGGYNLYNAGSEAVSARQNWWGELEPLRISQKIYDAIHDKNCGSVYVFPWLNEKPILIP